MLGVHYESIFQLLQESFVFRALSYFAFVDINYESKYSLLQVLNRTYFDFGFSVRSHPFIQALLCEFLLFLSYTVLHPALQSYWDLQDN